MKAVGLSVSRGVDYKDGYDFLVEDKVRLAVRYAFPTTERQQTYRKRNGEISNYVYKRWTFNFHRHGKIAGRYCDFFVCLLGSAAATQARASDLTVFTIPWEAITGLTFCSSCREGSQRSYRGKYSVYKDRWDLIADAVVDGGGRKSRILALTEEDRAKLKVVAGGVPEKKRRAGEKAVKRAALRLAHSQELGGQV